MKKFIYIAFALLISVSAFSQSNLEQANTAYSEGKFEEALGFYQQALTESGASAEVYFNIGNSYYKLNQVANSILYYERALLFDPADKDIRFNLEIAKLKAVDRIEPVGEFFLTKWRHSIQNLMSTNNWAYFSIVCFVLLIVCAFMFFFARIIALKKVGFFAGLVLLILVIFGNVFSYNQKKKLTNRNSAIIFSPTTTIKSSPDNSGTDLFILHEGTKVEIKSTLGNWSEIETADGNVGWIQSTEIEKI